MRPRRILSAEEASNMFDEAVRQNALAVLTVHEKGNWHTFKSRFLERDGNRRFIVLDCQETHGTQPPALSTGRYVGLSFRYKSRKVMFATVVEAKGRYLVDGKTAVPAVRYRWPESMTELQRRAYYRTPIPAEVRILVNVWPGGVAARPTAQGSALSVVTGEALDLSCGQPDSGCRAASARRATTLVDRRLLPRHAPRHGEPSLHGGPVRRARAVAGRQGGPAAAGALRAEVPSGDAGDRPTRRAGTLQERLDTTDRGSAAAGRRDRRTRRRPSPFAQLLTRFHGTGGTNPAARSSTTPSDTSGRRGRRPQASTGVVRPAVVAARPARAESDDAGESS